VFFTLAANGTDDVLLKTKKEKAGERKANTERLKKGVVRAAEERGILVGKKRISKGTSVVLKWRLAGVRGLQKTGRRCRRKRPGKKRGREQGCAFFGVGKTKLSEGVANCRCGEEKGGGKRAAIRRSGKMKGGDEKSAKTRRNRSWLERDGAP